MNKGNKELEPIILLGAQRSGTTALAYSLNNLFAQKNGQFTINDKIIYYLQRWLTDKDIENRHFRADEVVYSLKRVVPKGIPNENLWMEQISVILNKTSSLIADGTDICAIDFIRNIMSEIYGNYAVWGYKYNEDILNISYISTLFPKARFIILVRNPLDVANSILNWKKEKVWRPSSISENLRKWECWHQELISLINHWDKSKFIVLDYDKLCEGEYKKDLSSFLNMEIGNEFDNLKTKRDTVNFRDEDKIPTSTMKIWEKLNLLAFTSKNL